MENDRREAILDELLDVESIPELEAIVAMADPDYAEFEPQITAARKRLTVTYEAKVTEVPAGNSELILNLASRIAELEKLLKQRTPEPVRVPAPRVRTSKKYRMLSFNVSWSTKPQVHAVASLLEAHAAVGDILEEADIVRIMEANVHVLDTVQGGKRIWDYYKGKHFEGLTAHGNIEEVI